jgi:hypothetical protein
MSIVVLKRKTLAQYHNNSHSPDGFSLNGTHRSQGYIGQTSLSRSLPRTLMKGNTPKGHGGCCGKYYQGTIIQSGVTSLENPAVVKKSTMNTRGLIDTKYRWIRRPKPFAEVKLIANSHSQSEYIYFIKHKTLKETRPDGSPCSIPDKNPVYKECKALTKDQIGETCPKSRNITKPDSATGAITGDEYIYQLRKKCAVPEDFKAIAYIRRAPFTCGRGATVV